MSDKGKIYNIRRKLQVLALKTLSYEQMTKIYYFIFFKRKINLRNPRYFNEKIHWLKLHYYPKNEEIIKATDKFEVRNFLAKKGFGHYLNELYGVWDSWDEVNWDKLPKKFALKCTHGARYNFIISNKDDYDKNEVGKQVKKWLREDFSLFNAEKHYSFIKPRIICEKFLSGNMVDYKFFCFNGKPQFFYIASGFGHGDNEKMSFFNIDGTKADFNRPYYQEIPDNEIIIPENLNEMIELSKKLSKDFPFVRVDLFSLNGKIYFSELTFTPSGGLVKFEPRTYHKIFGDMLHINNLIK